METWKHIAVVILRLEKLDLTEWQTCLGNVESNSLSRLMWSLATETT